MSSLWSLDHVYTETGIKTPSLHLLAGIVVFLGVQTMIGVRNSQPYLGTKNFNGQTGIGDKPPANGLGVTLPAKHPSKLGGLRLIGLRQLVSGWY